STTFTFSIQDNGGTANGGTDTSANEATLTVNVRSVNDAPTAVDSAVTTNEDTDHVFAGADFSFTDLSDSPANGLAAVIVTSLPANGSLRFNGSALALVDLPKTVTAADFVAGKLVFRPAADANGSPYTTFKFSIQDNGGTANGGTDTSANQSPLAVLARSVNDAPTA